MREGLIAAFEKIRFDPEIRAVILTGAGTSFCAGADVDKMAGGSSGIPDARTRLQSLSHVYMRLLHALEKPVIAAVRGHAVGIGMSLALGCDILLASDTAKFGQTFRRIGLAPDGGAIWYLSRRLPMNIAKELVFTGRVIDATEAKSLGLANHVYPDADLMDRAMAIATDLAAGPTFALGLSKKLFHVASAPSMEAYLEYEAFVQPSLNQTEDHQEGVAAFREKRKPKFKGK